MLHIVWEFRVRREHREEFERYYGGGGTPALMRGARWVALFRRSPDYQGTLLLRDQAAPLRYLTIDTWKDREAWESFKRRFGAEYNALDLECEVLTESECCLGWFEEVE